MDKGPWTLYYNGQGELKGVISEDFEHDVTLEVTGNLDPKQRLVYCQWLARTLNVSTRPTRSGRPPTSADVVESVHSILEWLYGEPVVALLMWVDPTTRRLDLASNAQPARVANILRAAADRLDQGKPFDIEMVFAPGSSEGVN